MPAGSISFNTIPSNIRKPLFYAEVDNRLGGYYVDNPRAIIIGQTVTVQPATPVLINTVDQSKSLFGQGSMVARMVEFFKLNNLATELWVLPLADAGGSTAATGTVTFTGPATENGTIFLYVGGTLVQVGVVSGNTATQIAQAVSTEVNLVTDLPVIASPSAGVVTFTAKNKGTLGNAIDIRLNYRGSLSVEVTPAGVTAVVVAMSGGATNPTLSTGLAALSDEAYEYHIMPYTDTTSLDALEDYLAARWLFSKQLYGLGFTGHQATVGALDTLGSARNDPNVSIVGYYNSPTWSPEVAAAYGGVSANYLNIDPVRTLQTLQLIGVKAPPPASRMTYAEYQVLLFSGITPLEYVQGTAQIVRAITTYQKNAFNQSDPSYLDIWVRSGIAYVLRNNGYLVTQKFPRMKLAADGTRFGAGNAIVTPKIIKGEMIALYEDLEFRGVVQNSKGFKKELIVTINATDPNRIDVYYPLYLINNLSVFALHLEFSLTVRGE